MQDQDFPFYPYYRNARKRKRPLLDSKYYDTKTRKYSTDDVGLWNMLPSLAVAKINANLDSSDIVNMRRVYRKWSIWNMLPNVALYNINKYLSVTDIAKMRLVCLNWNRFICNNNSYIGRSIFPIYRVDLGYADHNIIQNALKGVKHLANKLFLKNLQLCLESAGDILLDGLFTVSFFKKFPESVKTFVDTDGRFCLYSDCNYEKNILSFLDILKGTSPKYITIEHYRYTVDPAAVRNPYFQCISFPKQMDKIYKYSEAHRGHLIVIRTIKCNYAKYTLKHLNMLCRHKVSKEERIKNRINSYDN
jgi:hypothetical protein